MNPLGDFVEGACRLLVRPGRAAYTVDQLVGGRDGRFVMNTKQMRRCDFVLPNARGDQLQASLYLEGEGLECASGKTCVVYLHGNCGCRLDANDVVRLLLPASISVCCFDFSGSGLSGGEYISLGAREPADLKVIVTFLRTLGVTMIGLWGRSMGAVTALRYVHTERDLSISGILADSPFTSLVELIHHLVGQKGIPRFATSAALFLINRRLRELGMDVNEVNTLESARSCYVPVLLAHGDGDSLIPPSMSERIVEEIAGDAYLMIVEGDHNDLRPLKFQRAARAYFRALLKGGVKTPESLFLNI